jgi:hypothetical protein
MPSALIAPSLLHFFFVKIATIAVVISPINGVPINT